MTRSGRLKSSIAAPSPLPAQRIYRAAVVRQSVDTATQQSRDALASATRVPRPAVTASKGFLIGVAVGAVLGAGTARYMVTRPEVTDHSEDGFAYLVCIPVGALAGGIVGAIVGAIYGSSAHTPGTAVWR